MWTLNVTVGYFTLDYVPPLTTPNHFNDWNAPFSTLLLHIGLLNVAGFDPSRSAYDRSFIAIMPETIKQDPSEAVEEILRKRNVELMDYIANHLVTFAAHLQKHGLIEKDTERNMRVTGLGSSHLAQTLMSAYHPSLTQSPRKKFPKFIAVMKEFEDMRELAEEMQADYERASTSRSTSNVF